MKTITLKELTNEFKTVWDETATVKHWQKYGMERLYFQTYTRSGYERASGAWDLEDGVIVGRPHKSNNWKATNELLEKYKGYKIIFE